MRLACLEHTFNVSNSSPEVCLEHIYKPYSLWSNWQICSTKYFAFKSFEATGDYSAINTLYAFGLYGHIYQMLYIVLELRIGSFV